VSKILIVDDESSMRRILASNLALDRHVVTEASGVSQAVGYLAVNRYDAVITDQKMPDGQGLDVLARVREIDPAVAVVLLTAFATVELAVEAMRQGAFDFVTKPFQPDVVRATARRACEHTQLLRENGLLRLSVDRLEGSGEIFGSSPATIAVQERIARVAPTNATVLITGETGTGKELVARAIHKSSARAQKPFVAVNCAAFTETLLESEPFGHEKGAFTGADRLRQCLFEAAHEGTLFLDEAGEMSPSTQAKLFRVLAEGKILRVGSTKPRDVDVRVVVATHRGLEERVKQDLFRQDLGYRLAVVPIQLAPLRARTEDIPGLCDLFCRDISRELKVPYRPMRPEAIEKLKRHAFPGNIRELRNLIERALILSSGPEIGPEDFPLRLSSNTSPSSSRAAGFPAWIDSLPQTVSLRELLDDVEKGLILRALNSSSSVQTEAARRLQLSRSDLSYKLTKFNIRAGV
jgi:two-component system, NtrC family, response regulator HydG